MRPPLRLHATSEAEVPDEGLAAFVDEDVPRLSCVVCVLWVWCARDQ